VRVRSFWCEDAEDTEYDGSDIAKNKRSLNTSQSYFCYFRFMTIPEGMS
jgi:hypothetical protein